MAGRLQAQFNAAGEAMNISVHQALEQPTEAISGNTWSPRLKVSRILTRPMDAGYRDNELKYLPF